MTGLTPHRTIHRLRAIGRTFFALGASLLLVATLAPFALAAEEKASASDDRAVFHSGNFSGEHCATEFGAGTLGTTANNAAVTTTVTTKDVTTTLNGSAVTYVGTQAVNVDVASGWEIVGVAIKAGNGYNQYSPGVDDMIAPLNPSGEPAGISHWVVCYRLAPLEADPKIVKSGPESAVTVGTAYSFTLAITNDGDTGSDTGAFTISDTVPAAAGSVTSVSGDAFAECENTGNVVTCDVSNLTVEDAATVTVNMMAPANAAGVCGPTHTNTANLSTVGDNSSVENDSSSDTVTFTGCTTITVNDPTPSVDVEKLVSLNGSPFADADTAPGLELDVLLADPAVQVTFMVIVTNTSGDGTVLTLNSLTDQVTAGGGTALDLSSCTFPAEGLADGKSVECELGPSNGVEGAQHTNIVTVSATGAGEPVGDSDPANYAIDRVGGELIERPDAPAAPVDSPEGEPEPAPEVEVLGVTEELPRTGPEDLWLGGFALMLLGAGLLTIARGKSMDATASVAGTSWTNRKA